MVGVEGVEGVGVGAPLILVVSCSFSSATTTVNVAKTGGSRSTSPGMFHQPFLKPLYLVVLAQSSNDLRDNNASPFVAYCKILYSKLICHMIQLQLYVRRDLIKIDRGHELVKALSPSRFVIIRFETTMYTWMYHVRRTYYGGLQDVLLFVISYLVPQASNFYIHGKVIIVQWLERRNQGLANETV